MAIIRPFRALRPVPEKAKHVSCVPYDVPYDAEVRGFIRHNPLNFLRVTRSEAEFPIGENPTKDEILGRAKENFQQFIADGVFLTETAPAFYIYRLSTITNTQTGIVACCSLDEYESGLIKKHEKTRPDKVEDRTNHMLAVRAQTGLIFLAFRGTDKIRSLIAETSETVPLYKLPCVDGVSQTIWRVEKTEEISEAFLDVPALYITDGHHRVESASLARQNLRDQNSAHTGQEEYNFVVAGIFPAKDLRILAYNRVAYDLNRLSETEFLKNCARTSLSRKQTNRSRKITVKSVCISGANGLCCASTCGISASLIRSKGST